MLRGVDVQTAHDHPCTVPPCRPTLSPSLNLIQRNLDLQDEPHMANGQISSCNPNRLDVAYLPPVCMA